jgi:hypothetical protein
MTIEAFQRFAMAFESAFAQDRWSLVGEAMTDDVGWRVTGAPLPFGVSVSGRAAALAAIIESTEGFDRRFDRRLPKIVDGPTVIPGGVHFTWVVRYERDGLPPAVLYGQEWDLFVDGKLEFHTERLDNTAELLAYVRAHDQALRPRRDR